MIETILLNFFFLLFPVLTALIFFEDKLTNTNKYILVSLTSFSLILCMAFPIKLDLGYIIDLRYIPFIIVALYGGYKMVFPLYLVLNAYRFYHRRRGDLSITHFFHSHFSSCSFIA